MSGYDLSGEALRQAATNAQAAGVKLATRLASHNEYDLGTAQWNLIVMSFAFTKLNDTSYMRRVRDSLRPGCVLLVEGFNGGPPTELNLINPQVVPRPPHPALRGPAGRLRLGTNARAPAPHSLENP